MSRSLLITSAFTIATGGPTGALLLGAAGGALPDLALDLVGVARCRSDK